MNMNMIVGIAIALTIAVLWFVAVANAQEMPQSRVIEENSRVIKEKADKRYFLVPTDATTTEGFPVETRNLIGDMILGYTKTVDLETMKVKKFVDDIKAFLEERFKHAMMDTKVMTMTQKGPHGMVTIIGIAVSVKEGDKTYTGVWQLGTNRM